MFKLQHVIHGFYPFELGIFDNVQEAVKAIKDRKGKMVDGVFVKEADL